MKIPRLIKEAQKKEYDINKYIKNLINIGIIGNYKSIGIIWSGLFPKVVM